MHTSYTDVLDLAAPDRLMLINLINEKQKATQEALESAKENRKNS